MTEERLKQAADDILRQVVCDCGNYRHHGVSWMPEGSGEGLEQAISILITLLAEAKVEYIIKVLNKKEELNAANG